MVHDAFGQHVLLVELPDKVNIAYGPPPTLHLQKADLMHCFQ
jgi:hypothetical protein